MADFDLFADQLLEEAKRFLEKAHELEPDNMSVLNTLGVLYVEVNRFEDGLRVFKHVTDT